MSKDSPKFGICLPNRNYSRFLADCIHSIQDQSYSNFIVLFCDGNSTDDSMEVFTQLTADDNRFRVFSENDNGQADAIHKCFSYLKNHSDVLYYINSDDILIDKECLSRVADYINRFPLIHLFTFSGFYLQNGHLTEINYNYSLFSGLNFIRRRPAFLQPSTFFLSPVYDQIQIDASYRWMFDACFFYKVTKRYNSLFVPERFSGHRLHGSNLTDVSDFRRTLEVARFYKFRYPRRHLLYFYILTVSFIQQVLSFLPRPVGNPLSKGVYLSVNTLSFLTGYLIPSI